MKILNYKKGLALSPSKGFTLIELIVVMAIFLFIIGAAIGIFISIIQSQKRILAEQQFINQISYVEEHMSKALRMAAVDNDTTDPFGSCIPRGYIYLLINPDTVTGELFTGIRFINQSEGNVCQEFYFDDNVLYERKNNLPRVPLTSSILNFDPANPIRFSINGLDGSVANQCGGSPDQPFDCGATNGLLQADRGQQPRVTILMNVGILGDSSNKTCTDSSQCTSGQACVSGKCIPIKTIQTTISRRNLNVQ